MGIWTGHHVRTRASAGAVSHDGPPDEGWPWGGPGVRAQVGAGVWDHTAKPEKQQVGGLSRARAQIQRSGLEASTEAPRRPGGSPHTPICSLPEVSPGRGGGSPPRQQLPALGLPGSAPAVGRETPRTTGPQTRTLHRAPPSVTFSKARRPQTYLFTGP